MHQTVTIQDFVITITSKEQNPTVLNPDLLKYTGIIPSDWELARQPIFTNQVAQLVFQNGVSLLAQPNRVVFSQTIDGKSLEEIYIPDVAQRYLKALPNVPYQSVGISLRGYVACAAESEVAQNYLLKTLLAPGSWQEFGKEPVKAGVNFVYTLERGHLSLAINSATLEFPEQTPVPGIVFAGSFSYNSTETAEPEQQGLSEAIAGWQADLDTYKDLINHKFLVSIPSESLIPDVFPMPTPAAA